MNQKFSYLQSVKIIILALFIAIGTSYVFAAFTAPVSAPPNCNTGDPGCDAPINVSLTPQNKLGRLNVNTSTSLPPNGPFAIGLTVFGKSIFTKAVTDPVALDINGTVKIVDGTQGAGKVLTSDATGNATWKESKIRVFSDQFNTWDAPDGVTKVNIEAWGSGGTERSGSYIYKHQVLVTPGTRYGIIVGIEGGDSFFRISPAGPAIIRAEGGFLPANNSSIGDIVIQGSYSIPGIAAGATAPNGGAGAVVFNDSNNISTKCRFAVIPGGAGMPGCSLGSVADGAPGRVILWWYE